MKRKMYIDIAKGIGITLVVFAHIYLNFDTGIRQIIYLFHMPLFFFLSGLLFVPTGKLKKFVIKRARSILVPYFFGAVLSVLYWLIIERQFRVEEAQIPVGKAFAGVFIASYPYLMFNVVLWFLPVLFLVELLFAIIYAFAKKSRHFSIWIIGCIVICGYIGIRLFEYEIPWGVNRCFSYIVFYAGGYALRNINLKKKKEFGFI